MRIRAYPDPALRKKSRNIEKTTKGIERLAEKMKKLTRLAGAYGLAAPQVGVNLRLFVRNTYPFVLINPEIVWMSIDKSREFEGCLSFPWMRIKLDRSTVIRFKAQTLSGRTVERTEVGINARIVQHEIDHLDGIFFIDHLTSFQRRLFRDKLKKIVRQGKKRMKLAAKNKRLKT